MNGEELKQQRQNAGLSQLELERISGVGRTYISLYENGRVAISDKHAECIERAFTSGMDEPQSPRGEYEALREEVHEKLAFAPPGLIWGIDTEARAVVLEEVLIRIAHMHSLLEEICGETSLMENQFPKGSVGDVISTQVAELHP